MSFGSNSQNNNVSGLRRTLLSSERKKAFIRPQLNGMPSEIDMIGICTQSKLDRRMVILPVLPPECPYVLQVCVSHNPASDYFDWTIYCAIGTQLNQLWNGVNASPSKMLTVIREAGRSMLLRKQSEPELEKTPMIGEFLVSNGIIPHNALVSALSLQRSSHLGVRPIGEILSLSGSVKPGLVEVAVALQGLMKRQTVTVTGAGELLKSASTNGWCVADVLQHVPSV
jgi:hypothetical protein